MKPFISLLLILVTLLFSIEKNNKSNKKSNISILPFRTSTISAGEASAISDLFAVAMVNSGNFKVLDSANMKKVLEEQAFQNSGCTDSACAVEIGKLLNMDFMVTGSVMKLGENYFVTASMVNVGTAQIEHSKKSPGFPMKDIDKTIDELVIALSPSQTATVAESKPKTKPKSTGKKNPIKVAAGILSIGCVATSGTMLGLSLYVTQKRDALIEEHESTTDPDFNFTDSKSDIDLFGNRITTERITAVVTGGGALIFGVLAIALPKEMNRRVAVIPMYFNDTASLTVAYKF